MSEPDYELLYPCIGVCMADPVSGLCQGCGRPLAEPEAAEPPPASPTPDTLPEAGPGDTAGGVADDGVGADLRTNH